MKTQRPRTKAESPFSRRFPSKVVALAQAVYKSLDTPVSRQLSSWLDDGQVLKVVDFSICPSDYETSESFRRDYLAVSLLSKCNSFDLGIDLQAEACRSFIERERECSRAALQLRSTLRSGSIRSTRTLYSVLHTAREKIAHLLGPFSWDEVEPFFGFGPGATYTRPHREGDPYYKFRAKPCTTHGCAILAYTTLRRVPAWFDHVARLSGKSVDEVERLPLAERLRVLFEIVPGNRVTFVPKSATKMRTIAIEPTMNGYIQHGLGKVLEKRLRRAGIDLHDQSKNQRMAQIGSSDGSLATLDLSAASDSVSLELCKQLLPLDWYEAICLTRSEDGVLPDGTAIKYSKVSSMGNGATFGLETLIFWGICASVVQSCSSDRRFTVYGDDIIVPTDAVHTVQWVLSACGFSLNPSKSFSAGPFRESCGKHYFRGDDVSPFYIREDVDTVPRVIWFANQIRRWSRLFWGLDHRMKPAYTFAVSQLPTRFQKPSIPDGFGDVALFGDLDEVCPNRLHHDVGDGWSFNAWVPVIKTREYGDVPFLLRQLSQPSSGTLVDDWVDYIRIARIGGYLGKSVRLLDDAFRVVPLRRQPVWRRIRASTSNWPSYGPWID